MFRPFCLLNNCGTCSLVSMCTATAFVEILITHLLEFSSSLLTSFQCHRLPSHPQLCYQTDQMTTSSLRSSSWDFPLPLGQNPYFLTWNSKILPYLAPAIFSRCSFSFLLQLSLSHLLDHPPFSSHSDLLDTICRFCSFYACLIHWTIHLLSSLSGPYLLTSGLPRHHFSKTTLLWFPMSPGFTSSVGFTVLSFFFFSFKIYWGDISW